MKGLIAFWADKKYTCPGQKVHTVCVACKARILGGFMQKTDKKYTHPPKILNPLKGVLIGARVFLGNPPLKKIQKKQNDARLKNDTKNRKKILPPA